MPFILENLNIDISRYLQFVVFYFNLVHTAIIITNKRNILERPSFDHSTGL